MWQYEFCAGGKRYRGSTRTTSHVAARRFEQARRLQVTKTPWPEAQKSEVVRGNSALWDVALTWFVDTAEISQSPRDTVSRIRKLFGHQMHLEDDAWRQAPGARYCLPMSLRVNQVTPEVFAALRNARASEGTSKSVIAQEVSLLRRLISYARASHLRQATERLFTPRNRAALQALASALTAYLEAPIEVRFGEGIGKQGLCVLEGRSKAGEPVPLLRIRARGEDSQSLAHRIRAARVACTQAYGLILRG